MRCNCLITSCWCAAGRRRRSTHVPVRAGKFFFNFGTAVYVIQSHGIDLRQGGTYKLRTGVRR